jgi:hypothetical protein
VNTSNSTSPVTHICAAMTAAAALAAGLTGLVAGGMMIRHMYVMMYYQSALFPSQALEHFLIALVSLVSYVGLTGLACLVLEPTAKINWFSKGTAILHAVLHALMTAVALFFLVIYIFLSLFFAFATIERGDAGWFLLMLLAATGLIAGSVSGAIAMLNLAVEGKWGLPKPE